MKQDRVVIAGSGVMGASLAQVYTLAGYETIVYGNSEAGIERGKNLISLNQETMIKEGLVTAEESGAAMERISFTLERDCFKDCFLVVENIVEDLEIKKTFWKEISEIVPEDALLATNTSGLSITKIAEACHGPERFMGQHWLNPPHLLPLCEIIKGEKTSEENAAAMRKLIEGMGKRPVVVKDISGFIVNRIQFAVLREALNIVDMGAASYEDVDTVLKAGLGLRYAALGAFGVADFGGLDTFDRINSYLNADLSDSKEGNKRLHDMVLSGKLGVKSGEGFYDYSGDKKDEAIRMRDSLYIRLAKLLYY